MKPETRAKIDQANKDWDRANEQCRVLLNGMRLCNIESPDWNILFGALCDEQANRSAAGDRHAQAMRESFEEVYMEVRA